MAPGCSERDESLRNRVSMAGRRRFPLALADAYGRSRFVRTRHARQRDILWQTGRLKPDAQARFQSRSGLLTAIKKSEWIELNFPAKPPEEAAPPPQMLEALGTKAQWVGSNRMDYFVLVESEEEVRRLRPNFGCSEAFRHVASSSRRAPLLLTLISFLDSLPPAQASMKIPQPVPLTAACRPFGAKGWGSGIWWVSRHPPAAA